jgi:hypothetical protein
VSITEKSRHELYRRLEEILGPDEANTLMEHLPPVGWAAVATKDDLQQLESRIDTKIDNLDARISSRMDNLDARLSGRIDSLESSLRIEIANLSTEIHSTLRTNSYLTIGAMAALVTLISAVASLN